MRSAGLLFALIVLAGCTSERGYETARAWQLNECNRTPDSAERERCMARAGGSYEAYTREADALRKR